MSHTRLLAILAFFFSFGMIVLGDSLPKETNHGPRLDFGYAQVIDGNTSS